MIGFKVQTFWETHKNLRNLPHALYIFLVNVKTMRRIFSNFVCYSKVLKVLKISFKKDFLTFFVTVFSTYTATGPHFSTGTVSQILFVTSLGTVFSTVSQTSFSTILQTVAGTELASLAVSYPGNLSDSYPENSVNSVVEF